MYGNSRFWTGFKCCVTVFDGGERDSGKDFWLRFYRFLSMKLVVCLWLGKRFEKGLCLFGLILMCFLSKNMFIEKDSLLVVRTEISGL